MTVAFPLSVLGIFCRKRRTPSITVMRLIGVSALTALGDDAAALILCCSARFCAGWQTKAEHEASKDILLLSCGSWVELKQSLNFVFRLSSQ